MHATSPMPPLVARRRVTSTSPWMRTAWMVLTCMLAACAPADSATGVVVRISAEPGLDADIRRIVTRVFGSDGRGDDTGGVVVSTSSDIPIEAGTRQLPYTIGVAPRDWDASRIYRLEVEAYDANGTLIASAKIISGYRPGSVLEVPLLLEDVCRGVLCSAVNQTCKRSMCVDAHVDPTTLPEYGSDAAVMFDASMGDAGSTADAGQDGGVQSCDVGYAPGASGCVDVDECATLVPCTMNASCTNTPGSYRCDCDAGYQGDGTVCADVDECATNNGGCDPRTACTNTPGGRTCSGCPSGYMGDGATGCVDVDECATSNGGCDALTVCTNLDGSRSCSPCPSGYTGSGETGCVDVDECATSNGGCDPNTTCQNLPGSASCGACPAGFSGTGNTGCVDVDECATGNGGCDPSTSCTNTFGGRTCSACPPGFTGDGETGCVDVNECATSNGGCDPVTLCQNTFGGRTCGNCPIGYSGTGTTGCTNIDDCLNAPCQNGGVCTDDIPSYVCSCPAGWTGTNCNLNIDDCTPDPCQNGGSCVDGVAAYTCSCPAGYTGVNCESIVSGCASTPCVNGSCMDTGPGTYACTCDAGWLGVNCDTPADACSPTNPCQNGGACASTGPGTYSCTCLTGFTGTQCELDVDECATDNGGCSTAPMVACTNLPGSRSCGPCPAGYGGDGVTCAPIDCGSPTSVANGTYVVSGGVSGGATTTFGATAAFTCGTGFSKSGADISCQANGTWTQPAPTCTGIAAFCPAPSAIANDVAGSPVVSGGVAGGSTTSFGATASYSCSAGYGLVGTSPSCQANGTWSATPSCAAIAAYCPAVSAPTNGSVGVSGGIAGGSTTSLNATAGYACAGGFTLSGSASRTCGSTGTWSGTAATCVDVNECTLGTDLCSNSPAATCTNTAGSYTCTCPSGYAASGSPSGSVCSDINECSSGTSNCDTSPAACVNSVGSYSCTCPANYVGTGVGSTGCQYDVATLSNLTVTGATLAPAFSATQLVYTVQIPAGGGSFTFTPTVAVTARQTIRINGVVQTSGTAKSITAPADALTPVITTVTVTAESGRVTTYTLVATKSHFLVGTTGGGDNYVPDVAVSGDGLRLALADMRDGTLGQYARGAVFLYRNVAGTWSYETVFRASDGIGQDNFGSSVALSNDGTTVAVGATGVDAGGTYDVGAVYVFKNTSGTWAQQTKLLNADPDAYDAMGSSVDLSSDGNTLATGVPGDDITASGTTDAGGAYVFLRSGTTWGAATYVKASNPGASDAFGKAISLSYDGMTLAVGAPNEDGSATGVGGTSNELAADAGAVYTFLRSGSAWNFYRYVKASNTGAGDHFGSTNALELSNDGLRLVVGAPDEDSSSTGANGVQANESAVSAGAAYVFTRTASTPWVQNAYLKASNTNANDRFGASATISGDGTRIAIGAIGEASALQSTPTDNTLAGAGAVYVFLYSGFTQATYLKATSPIAGTEFGFGVSYSTTGTVFGVATHNRCEGGGVATVDVVSRTDNSRNAAWGNQGAVYLY